MARVDPATIDLNNLPSLLYQARKALPDAAGLYFLKDRESHNILYIGQTVSLLKRFDGHHRRKHFAEVPGLIVSYLLLESSELLECEALFIHYCRPSLNGRREPARSRYKPSATNRRCYNLYLHPDDAEWGKTQPGGLSALLRLLLTQERQRREAASPSS